MINRDKIKNDNGVTLIALVITIAVLLILAGVTIAEVFSDDGLWDKSNQFAESANATIEENSEQVNNMINELDEIMNPWVQNKTVVTKKMKSGTKTYNVGDDYTYDCGVSGYTGKWKVLGAERGKLLIMSTVDIGRLELSGKEGYNTGVTQLNNMCAPYGKNARSITVEDINRVTGYDPTKQNNNTKYGAGEFYEYGNKVTYTASGSSATNGKTYTSAISKYEHPDGRILGQNDVTSIQVESTYYYYYPSTLTTSDGEQTGEIGISKTIPAYKLLFRKADDTANCSYWLASSYVYTSSNRSLFGLRGVRSEGRVNGSDLWGSHGGAYGDSDGVRAVVTVD